MDDESNESMTYDVSKRVQSVDVTDEVSLSKSASKRKLKKDTASLDILRYSKSAIVSNTAAATTTATVAATTTNKTTTSKEKSHAPLARMNTISDTGDNRNQNICNSDFSNNDKNPYKQSNTSSCDELFGLLEELSLFEEIANKDGSFRSIDKSSSFSTSHPSDTHNKYDSSIDHQKDINEMDKTITTTRDSKSLSITNTNERKIDSLSSYEIENTNLDIDDTDKDNKIMSKLNENEHNDASLMATTTTENTAIIESSTIIDRVYSIEGVKSISEDDKLSDIYNNNNIPTSSHEPLYSSKDSVGSLTKPNKKHRKSKNDYENVRESKIKSRMTLFNAYKILKQATKRNISIDLLTKTEDTRKKNLLTNFYKMELGYFKCVKYIANFERLITESMKSSSTAVFSKNEFNKLQLNYMTLENHMKRLESLLDNKKNSLDNDTCVIDYFGELTPLRIHYKTIATTMDRFLLLIQKNKSSGKMKKIYPQELRITEWNKTISIEHAIINIYEHIHYYIEFLNSLLPITEKTDNEYKHLRLVTNQLIILWDVLRVCRIGKKNSVITRSLTITTPVVEFCGDEKRKYRILYIFMDCLVISSQSTKSPVDLVAKYCFPLKKCVCSRTFQGITNLTDDYEKKINFLKGRIACTKDLISKFEHSNKKSDTSKIDKLNKRMNEDQYQLVLISPKYPLSICFNHKLTQTFLFDNESDAIYWDFLINNRSSCALMDDETSATLNEVQTLINDFTSNLLKIDNNNNNTTLYLEEQFIPPNNEPKQEEALIPVEYMNHCLRLNVLFRRHENLVGDIYFKLECDYYGIFFEKYKSGTLKSNGPICHTIILMTEQSQSIGFEVFKLKGRNESLQSGPINLCRYGILNKPYVRFRHYFENIGSLLVYAECYSYDFMYDPSYKISIDSINHFQPSIEKICNSEYVAVPDVMKICVEKIEELGLDTIGLYRISGTANKLVQLREEFAKNMILDGDDLDNYEIHDMCGTVKSFLRDLQFRLIPKDCVEYFLKWNNNPNKNLIDLHSCIERLPRANQTTFYFLMNHLVKITRMSSVNKMTSANLSTVFGPNLFGEDQSENAHQESLFTYVSIVKSFIDVCESSPSNL